MTAQEPALPLGDAATAATSGIVARGLTRRFGAQVAVDDVSLEVAPGQVVGLLGPNGAGKTTTLRMLATLLSPSSGAASVGGADVVRDPLGARARLGYLTGDTGLYARLTPREVLAYFGELHGLPRARIRQRTDALVDLLGLGPFADKRCGALSTGQKQRVSIARAVLHDPPVLILDEPTSGLDILAARDILRFFRAEADRGKAVLLSTHIMAEVELICDRATIIHRARVRHAGTLAELAHAAGAPTLSAGFFDLLGEGDAGPPQGEPP